MDFKVRSLGPRDDNCWSGLQEPCGHGDLNLFQEGVCIIERNTNEGSRSDPTPKEVQNIGAKKIMKSTHRVFQQENDSSGSENEATVHGMSGLLQNPGTH